MGEIEGQEEGVLKADELSASYDARPYNALINQVVEWEKRRGSNPFFPHRKAHKRHYPNNQHCDNVSGAPAVGCPRGQVEWKKKEDKARD